MLKKIQTEDPLSNFLGWRRYRTPIEDLPIRAASAVERNTATRAHLSLPATGTLGSWTAFGLWRSRLLSWHIMAFRLLFPAVLA